MNIVEAMKQWTLIYGLGDWVALTEIEGEAKYLGVPSEQWLDLVCEVIKDLESDEMIEIGSVTREGFAPWKSSIDESIAKIRGEYTGPDDINWGYIAWLNSLPKGIEAGEKILAEGSEYAHLWQDD